MCVSKLEQPGEGCGTARWRMSPSTYAGKVNMFPEAEGGRLNDNEDGIEELLEGEFKGCTIGDEQVWS